MAEPLSGIVLAGGNSRRLGTDKTTLTFDGHPLLEIVIERVSTLCHEVIVACGSRAATDSPRLPVRFVNDAIPEQGPLAGVQAGLTAATAEFALVVACDMPFLNPRLLAYMANLPRRYQALIPLTSDGWHPTHAVYSHSCLPIIEALLAQGSNSMEELLSQLDIQALPEEELRRHDPDGLSLFNLNDPQDLTRARAIWKRAATESQVRPA